ARAGDSGRAAGRSGRAPGLLGGFLPALGRGRSRPTGNAVKPRLQTSLGQHLVLTPQLRQALHLLQLSIPELELKITAAVESNPLLEWEELSTADAEPGTEDDDSRDERSD